MLLAFSQNIKIYIQHIQYEYNATLGIRIRPQQYCLAGYRIQDPDPSASVLFSRKQNTISGSVRISTVQPDTEYKIRIRPHQYCLAGYRIQDPDPSASVLFSRIQNTRSGSVHVSIV